VKFCVSGRICWRRRRSFNQAQNSLGVDAASASLHTLEGPGLGPDATARALLSQVQSPGSGPGITYEVYLNKSEQNPLIGVDRRVDSLCRAVGTEGGPLLGKMQDLQNRLQLTEEYKLDAVVRRTKTLVTEIETLEVPEQKQEQDRNDAVRIATLRALFASRGTTVQNVPGTVSRVKTRQAADDKTAQLLLRLKRLQQTHEAVQKSLVGDQQLLAKVACQMEANLQTTTANLRQLQQRLGTL